MMYLVAAARIRWASGRVPSYGRPCTTRGTRQSRRDRGLSTEIMRGRFLGAAAAGAAWVALGATEGCESNQPARASASPVRAGHSGGA
jgi:hypothetical protein